MTERYNPEYKRRRLLRQIDGAVPCSMCGQPRGADHYGKWCPGCYLDLTQLSGHETPARQLDREERITVYAERAQAAVPLFDPPLVGVMK